MELPTNISEFFKSVFSVYSYLRLRLRTYKQAMIVEQTAQPDIAEAMAILGAMHSTGVGLEKDYIQAINWYRKAANQGNPSAQLIVGTRYALGIGVMQNYTEAFRWYCEAARQNHVKAQIALGIMYATGIGVEKNKNHALVWLSLVLDEVCDDLGEVEEQVQSNE